MTPANMVKKILSPFVQLTNVNDPEFRCYELDLKATAGSTGTATVQAGATIGFKGDWLRFQM